MKPNRSTAGSSLIIVLAFVVLLTLLAVVFLSRVQVNYPMSNSSASGSGADLFCAGALDQITGDLRQEIVDGSTVVTPNGGGGTKVYLPTTGAALRQNILPYPVLPTAMATSTDPGVMNVVKESLGGEPFYPAGGGYAEAGPARAASSSSTTEASLNGRSISNARWNAPLLLPPVSNDNLAPATTSFQAPDWIYVARDGTNPTAYDPTSMANAAANNNSFVVGRYAYMMYDESALLDVNAAGMPAATVTAQDSLATANTVTNSKGSVALADLTATGLAQSDVDQIVGWRNFASAQPGGSFPGYSLGAGSASGYLNTVLGIPKGSTTLVAPLSPATLQWEGARTTGFLSAANQTLNLGQTDHLFSSRQELIQLLLNGVAQDSASARERIENALPYLGTFSLSLNSPSWMPVTPAGASGADNYGTQALGEAKSQATSGTAKTFNNQMPAACLVQKSFQRDDGTTAQIGDPLMKYRFPLRRLEWFNTVNQAANVGPILKWFCLRKDTVTGMWQYVDPDGKAFLGNQDGVPTIDSLAQVSALGREPTFWEVLQAAILAGSLADNVYGSNLLSNNATKPFDETNDMIAARQIFQIGMNIIDQYNSNPVPTVIELNPNYLGSSATASVARGGLPIAGIKNLPYIVAIARQVFPTPTYPPPTSTPTSQTKPAVNYVGYNQPLLWNPNYNYGSMATSNIRVVPSGQDYLTSVPTYSIPGSNPPSSITVTTLQLTNGPNSYGYANPGIEMDGVKGTRFRYVDIIEPADVASFGQYCSYPTPANAGQSGETHLGFYMGQVTLSTSPSSATSPEYAAYDPTYSLGGPWYQTGSPTSGTTGIPAGKKIDWAFNSTAGNKIPPNFQMQVRDPNTHLWIPYQTIPAWQAYGSSTCAYKPGMQSILSLFKNPPQTGTNGVNQLITLAYFLSDPRTLRFGTPTITNLSSQPNVDLEQGGTPQAFGQTATFGAGLFNPATLNAYPSSWAYNALGPRCSSTYQDADGVTRVGDGNPALAPAAASAWESAAVVGAPPSKAAPYFLGRSFNSVADMGYASRDMAWKSVNFFTADSADSALLDFFSLTESPAYAGGVNVNTASVPVLTALLQGAAADTSDNTGSGRLTAAQAKAIATAIRSYLGTTRTKLLSTNNRGGPGTGSPYNPGNANNNTIAFDPSDIARINEAVTDAGVINISTPPFGVSAVPYGEKRAQEVVARALADSWNTRTWNLMIDIIAQTGRFPRSVTTGGTDFGANFVVTGERREWAHVAIDRFTGKVLAVKVEPVNE